MNVLRYFQALYKDYSKFALKEYEKNIHSWMGVKEVKNFSEELIKRIFLNYMLDTFFIFVDKIRTLYFENSIESVIKKYSEELWSSYLILEFLREKSIIEIRNGKISFLKDFNSFYLKPLSEREVKNLLKRKIKLKNLEIPVALNLQIKDFVWKEKFDQLPIDTKSAIFVVSKISHYYPFKNFFAFIGDDDFISIIFKLIYPEMKITVFDADEDLLQSIEKVAKKFDIEIKVKKARVEENFNKTNNFYGCVTNPPYNLKGSITFLEFSKKLLSKKGGRCFLILGNEAIGRRYLELQKKISESFIIREIIPSRISYPFYEKLTEDREILERLKSYGVKIEKRKILFASLYVLDFVNEEPEKINFNSTIYTYL
ncbi:MAG: bis-aminopropyl spermidine synthase family protein [Candidatus Aenigmatarchaeota archaeon]